LPREPSLPPIDIIPLTREELAATDAMLLRSRGHGNSKAADANSADVGGGAGSGAGEGPGGARLYNAEWYRKPTNAELSFYLPSGTGKTGWGMIACQTVEGYRVDNCRELGQSPLGSGLSRAVRQAAWQFRVLPPRINGRPIIGAWVRIRIEFSEGVVD
jgi:protein TonB